MLIARPIPERRQPPGAAYTLVNGRMCVREGQLTGVELAPLVERHNHLARQLVNS